MKRGTGARGLRGVMEHLLRRTMYEIPSQKNISHCIVDEQVVLGEKSAQLKSHSFTDIIANEPVEQSQNENETIKEVPQLQ